MSEPPISPFVNLLTSYQIMDDSRAMHEELVHAFQYHTEHNYRPPSHDSSFGKVRLSPEVEQAISDSPGEVKSDNTFLCNKNHDFCASQRML